MKLSTILLSFLFLILLACQSNNKSSESEEATNQEIEKLSMNDSTVPSVNHEIYTTPDDWLADSIIKLSEVDKWGIDNFFRINEINDDLFAMINNNSFNKSCPVSRDQLRVINLIHIDFDGGIKHGKLICNKKIAEDVAEIFKTLYKSSYPIESVKLIEEFGNDDVKSMAANNTSCFNSRKTTSGSKISRHAYGMAIDINPLYNPYIKKKTGEILPSEGSQYINREKDFLHKINKEDQAYKEFSKYGFRWGGNWRTIKDYQHFEK